MIKKAKSPFLAFGSWNYSFYWVSFFAFNLALQMYVVGINWHVYTLTHSPASLGLLGIANFLPTLIFALPGGIAADWLNRKYLLITTQALRACMGAVLLFSVLSGNVSVIFLYSITAINALLVAFDLPSRQSVLPHIVEKEHFINAVGLSTVAREASFIIGPGITGFLISFLGIKHVYIFAALSSFISVLCLLPIKIGRQYYEEKISADLKSVMEGIRFVLRSPLITGAMLLDFIATFFSTTYVLLPIFAKEILGSGVASLGVLYAASSIGGVISGIVFSSFQHINKQGKILIAAVILYGVATIGFGLSKSFFLSFIFLLLTGAGDMISTIIRNTLRQMLTPDHIRGRMVSVNMIFFIGGPQLGNAEAGFAAALLGVPMSVVLGGVGTIVFTLLLVKKIPKLWHYQAKEFKAP